jgi:hypothetical protein
VVSKPKEWAVTLDVDYIHKTFAVKNVVELGNDDYVSRLFIPYIIISAADELGAFSRAVDALTNIGFTSARGA